MKRFFVCLLILFLQKSVCAVELQIQQSGYYILGDSLVGLPAGPDTLIAINASNVILDLNQKIVRQGNAVSLVDGIQIAPGLSNIVIKNGIIRDVTHRGIVVGSGCQNIVIDECSFQQCGQRAVSFEGTALAPIENSSVLNCSVYRCGSSTATSALIRLAFANGCTLRAITLSQTLTTGITTPLSFVQLDSCFACECDSVVIEGNSINVTAASGTRLTGFDFVATHSCYTHDCTYQSNSMNVTGVTPSNVVNQAFRLRSLSSAHSFDHCIVLTNTTNGSFIGFAVENGTGNSITRSVITSNQAAIFAGITSGSSLASQVEKNRYAHLIISNNQATSALAPLPSGGFVAVILNRSQIQDAIIENNRGATSFYGIVWSSSQDNYYSGNLINRNNGPTGATSGGIVTISSPSANDLFVQNIAFKNGDASLQQLQGVPAGSRTISETTASINAITGVFTNIGIVS